jgi:hypothetical protein
VRRIRPLAHLPFVRISSRTDSFVERARTVIQASPFGLLLDTRMPPPRLSVPPSHPWRQSSDARRPRRSPTPGRALRDHDWCGCRGPSSTSDLHRGLPRLRH